MTKDDLEKALLLHGADVGRWPIAVAKDAQVLIADDPEARALVTEMEALDGVLRRAVAAEPVSSAAVGQILAKITTPKTAAAFASWRLAAAGMALAASIAGFSIGFFGEISSPADEAMFIDGGDVDGADMDIWSLL